MKTFTYIAHKQFIRDIKYDIDINVNNYESHTNGMYFKHIFNNHNVETNLHIDFVKCVFLFSSEPKFQDLNKNYIDNFFISDENRELYMDFFCKIQKTYWAFNKFAKHIKSRYSKVKVTDDLFLTPIIHSQKNQFRLHENNCCYLFTLQDLSRIIISAVCNSPMFYSEPIPPKNPYSGVPFSTSNLYNIYFAIKTQLAIMPNVIYHFFLCEFNLDLFAKKNQLIIRDTFIKQYVSNEDEEEIIESIYDMLNECYSNINIDDEFPNDILIETFKPLLTSYLHYRYSFDTSKRLPNYRVMSRKMNHIIKKCPRIGRKLFVFKDNKKYISFVTLNGNTEPVLYVKPEPKYTIVNDDTSEDERVPDESNNQSFELDPEFSNQLDELIHVTDVQSDNLYDTDEYFDSDDEIEVNEDLYDP